MTYEHILAEREDGVGILTLNRPDVLNAMNRKLGVELLDGLERIVGDLRIHRIRDAGHWVQNEAPEEVTRLLLEFLQSLFQLAFHAQFLPGFDVRFTHFETRLPHRHYVCDIGRILIDGLLV